MKPLQILTITAVAANILSFLLYDYAAAQPGGSGGTFRKRYILVSYHLDN